MTTLPPDAFVCRPLERAELPRTVWHIAVAALIGNAWGPVYDVASQFVVSGSRWSGPMGKPPRKPDGDARVQELAARVFAP
jgi:hypothetical protein